MPTDSPYPSIDIPNVGIFDFLFSRKDRDFPDNKELFVDSETSRSYTYSEVKSTAIQFGRGLQAVWDWQKGDVLALFTPNCIDYPPIVWGTHFAGGIVTSANFGYTVDELAFQLKDSGAKAMVTQRAVLDIARQAAKRVGMSEDHIALMGDERDPEHRIKHFTSIFDNNLEGPRAARPVKVDPHKDLAFLAYSSGTTGLPKGVMLSHRNIVSNVLQVTHGEPELSPDDTILSFLPFFHIYGLTCVLHQGVYRGFKSVVMAKFAIEDWCRLVQDHRTTFSYVVPPVVLQLSKHPCVDKYDLSSIRMMNSGAAPLTKELVHALYERTKLKVKQGYGLSETSPTTHMQPWKDWERYIGSVGPMVPNQTAKFMDAEEKEVAVGEVGELWIKGPNVFKGYLNNPEGTKNAITDDGYFKTGDVGYLDDKGNFYITDRVKELIKYKGFQVPPAELEGLLASHPKVDDVAVVGIYKDDIASEVPVAWIVPKAGMQASSQLGKEIVDWVASKVANHKRLRGGVKFVDEIPKSASGKILRRLLKQRYEEEAKKGPKAKL